MKRPTLENIVRCLNKELRVRSIKDASTNGLQVRSRKSREISIVGFAVDACISTFEKAKKQDVDLLVVHHGITWRPQKDKGLADKRAAYLKKNNMALYAAHLPLDLHKEYGNNMQLARLLDVQGPRRFGNYHGIKIGYAGDFKKPANLSSIAKKLNAHLKSTCRIYRFGKEQIRSIGIVSGGGGSMLADAVKERLDCFLVGEIDLAIYNAAKEHEMNLIVAGHYATETVGVKALIPFVRNSFNVKTVFITDQKDL
jgi:dinuclear metal center YbgI/SA1388 family protein